MAKKLSEHELRQQAIKVLAEKLGPVEALRFLALVSRAVRLSEVAKGVLLSL